MSTTAQPEPLPCNREQVSDAEFHQLGLCLDGRSDTCWCEYVREQWAALAAERS